MNDLVQKILKRYEDGERNFTKIHLYHADLRGVDLSGANLSNADLSKADLKGANLSNAKLESAYLNETLLDDANLNRCQLEGSLLLKTRLIKTNLKKANLANAQLTGSFVLQSNLEEANLDGTYLKGVLMSNTNCKKAYYTDATYFDSSVNPRILGMQKLQNEMIKTPIDKILKDFNYLGKTIERYMGKTMMIKYWENSRPRIQWLENFSIHPTSKKVYYTGQEQFINIIQRQDCQDWANQFVQNSSKIVRDLSNLIEANQLILQISWTDYDSPDNTSESLF